MEVSFEALRRLQLQERNHAVITPLEASFYEDYRKHVEFQREALHKGFSLEAASVYEGTRKLLSEVALRRQQKVFLKALRDVHGGDVSGEGLAREEKELYHSLVKLVADYEAKLFSSMPASPAVPAAAGEKELEVQVVSEVPQFVGVTGVVGPFGVQQIVKLAKDDAQLLIEQGLARKV
ncbi:MAG: hypothetical protein AABW54_02860 [Candidatus Micrarchaeota archaeon]